MNRKKLTNKMNGEKKIVASQMLSIKSRGLSQGLLFSKFELPDDEEMDATYQLNNFTSLKENEKKLNNKTAHKLSSGSPLQLSIKESRLRSGPSISHSIGYRQTQRDARLEQKIVKSKNAREEQKKMKSIKTNHDLYAETIAKKLGVSDSSLISLIKFVIETIGPALAFKLSARVLVDEKISDFDDPPIKRFIHLVTSDESISVQKRCSITIDKILFEAIGSFEASKIKKRRINKSVDSIQEKFSSLALGLDALDSNIKEPTKEVKIFDFK